MAFSDELTGWLQDVSEETAGLMYDLNDGDAAITDDNHADAQSILAALKDLLPKVKEFRTFAKLAASTAPNEFDDMKRELSPAYL